MSQCPDCDGTGEVVVHVEPEVNYAEVDECPTCGGTGEVDPYQLAEDRAYSAAEARWQDDRAGYAG